MFICDDPLYMWTYLRISFLLNYNSVGHWVLCPYLSNTHCPLYSPLSAADKAGDIIRRASHQTTEAPALDSGGFRLCRPAAARRQRAHQLRHRPELWRLQILCRLQCGPRGWRRWGEACRPRPRPRPEAAAGETAPSHRARRARVRACGVPGGAPRRHRLPLLLQGHAAKM